MSHFLANVQRENAENIEKAKGTRGGKTKETIIYEELNILWKNTWKRTINRISTFKLLNYGYKRMYH